MPWTECEELNSQTGSASRILMLSMISSFTKGACAIRTAFLLNSSSMKLNRQWIQTQALNSILRIIMLGLLKVRKVRIVATDLTQMTSTFPLAHNLAIVVGMMPKVLTQIASNMAEQSKIKCMPSD